MSGYVLSPAAQADLGEIWDYTVERWNADQADRYILNIRNACEALVSRQLQGVAIDEVRHGYRKLAVGSHVLFFRRTGDGLINVVRILHQRMDVAAHLQN